MACTIIPLSDVKNHRTTKSAWVVIDNCIYDLTKFLDEHPGGAQTILDVAGMDASKPFYDVGHSDDARQMMKKYRIGILPVTDQACSWDTRGRSMPCPDAGGGGGKLKWALLALAGALVIGFVLNRYLKA